MHRAPATVKKERAALSRLARYLHTLGAIDATEILMVETAGARDGTPTSYAPNTNKRPMKMVIEHLIAIARAAR